MEASINQDPSSIKLEKGPKPFYHIEAQHIASNRVQAFLKAFAAILQDSNYRLLLDLYARTSSKCGRCAVSCQVYQASGDWRDIPCYRSNILLDIYRRHFTPSGWMR